jgi:hypothetical protein
MQKNGVQVLVVTPLVIGRCLLTTAVTNTPHNPIAKAVISITHHRNAENRPMLPCPTSYSSTPLTSICPLPFNLNRRTPSHPFPHPVAHSFLYSYDRLSDYCVHKANRFADAPRQSMDMKTPSPGAVYNVDKCYWNGPVKNIGISFNKDQRYILVVIQPFFLH